MPVNDCEVDAFGFVTPELILQPHLRIRPRGKYHEPGRVTVYPMNDQRPAPPTRMEVILQPPGYGRVAAIRQRHRQQSRRLVHDNQRVVFVDNLQRIRIVATDGAALGRTGTVHPELGWLARDYLGIDQGPILLQAANYRDDFVWKHMGKSPAIRLGLKRAGFTGGWLG